MTRCHFCGRPSASTGPLYSLKLGHGRVLAHDACETDWCVNVSHRLVWNLVEAATFELFEINQGKRCDL